MARKEKRLVGYQRPGTNTTILLRDSILTWFFALPFLFGGILFVIAPWGLASNSDQLSLVAKLALSSMGFASAFVAFIIVKAGLDEILLDRSCNRVIFGKRFSKRIIRTIDCQTIADITISTSKDSEGDEAYRLQFVLKSGEIVPLTKSYLSLLKTAEYERARIKHLLKNPYEAYAKKDPTPWLAFGNSDRTVPPGLKLLIIVCAVVTAAPFVGWWLAALEKPSLSIKAGAPEQTLTNTLRQQAHAKIAANENILFVATPEPGHEGMAKIVFIPFAIIWTIFSICWVGGAITGIRNDSKIGGSLMVLWGLPFVAVGLGMLSIPYFSQKRERHTIYALTDHRALVFADNEVSELVKFSDQEFGPINAKPYGKSKMDLLFCSSSDPETIGAVRGFWGIEGGEAAKAILEAKLKEKSKITEKQHRHH